MNPHQIWSIHIPRWFTFFPFNYCPKNPNCIPNGLYKTPKKSSLDTWQVFFFYLKDTMNELLMLNLNNATLSHLLIASLLLHTHGFATLYDQCQWPIYSVWSMSMTNTLYYCFTLLCFFFNHCQYSPCLNFWWVSFFFAYCWYLKSVLRCLDTLKLLQTLSLYHFFPCFFWYLYILKLGIAAKMIIFPPRNAEKSTPMLIRGIERGRFTHLQCPHASHF